MNIDRGHILKLAELANLSMTDEELDLYIDDINKVLDLVSQINEVNVEGVKPLYNVLDQMSDTRNDVETIKSSRDDVLMNAPDTDGVYFQVPETIKHNKEKK
tara:strand:- start:98 stop:403 length:306 start_codon:yes stop_codon:yes gene_type:complete